MTMSLHPIRTRLLQDLIVRSPAVAQLRTLSASNTCTRKSRHRSRKRSKPTKSSNLSKKILFQSLGCPRNFVDTEVMLGVSISEGNMEITQDVGDADVVVVNTCGFLESAREESRTAIQDMIDNKRPDSKLLVTGCMVNLKQQQQTILTDFPDVDAILSSGKIDKVMNTIRELDDKGSPTENNTDSFGEAISPTTSETPVSRGHRKSFLEAGETPRFLATPPHYAYLKIAEGCRKQCSFCIIPKLKGRLQSKPIDQIVDEFSSIVQHGTAKEVILIAQDLGDYGKDWKMQKHGGDSSTQMDSVEDSCHLTTLLRSILQVMDGNENNGNSVLQQMEDPFWIRLLYLYPDEITPNLIDLMEQDRRIARYVDLPIQHSHNDILQAMRRKTSGEQIQDTIQQLRTRLPDICIRTSLMVGFPGETEKHFEHLLNFVREQKLDHVGVFTYSDEKMAHSSRLHNHVSEEVKQSRYRRLMETQWQVVERKYQQWMKDRKTFRVVIEGLHESDPSRIVGRHAGQCPDIDGQVILEGHPRVFAGERYWVEMTGYEGFDLVAKVIE